MKIAINFETIRDSLKVFCTHVKVTLMLCLFTCLCVMEYLLTKKNCEELLQYFVH